MPDTGAPYNLRYPGLTDAANVPADMQLLATDVVAGLKKVIAASGTVQFAITTANTAITAPVVFPVGRFTAAPSVVVNRITALGAGHLPFVIWASGITATGFNFNAIAANTGGVATYNWIAVLAP